jgi:RNA polymerase sigma-70 factor (ECF subfamily)
MADPKPGIQSTALPRERDRDDAQLVARIAAGDERALGSLYDAYGAVVYGLAVAITRNQELAESVVADAFAAVWREARAFDPTRRSVFAWVSSMVRALALAARRPATAAIEAGSSLLSDASPVGAALARLTGPQRMAVELAYFGGLPRAEIAIRLGESESTVSTYLRTAMDALRHVLAPEIPGTARPVDISPRQVAGL